MNLEKKIAQFPNKPGIYLFYDKDGELIYVGKATSLKNRVRSYFRGKKTPRPIELMIDAVANIKYRTTDSALEAAILEANTIKKKQPKYNVEGKDDKSWNYIVITKDKYPQVKTLRQHDMSQLSKKDIKKQFKYVFGPYPGLNTKATMKLLRKMFSISSCKPRQDRPCLYYQMGQCLGVCTGEISTKDYTEKVIKPLVTLLRGGKKRLVKAVEKQMKLAAKEKDFEEAARLRDQLGRLQRIQDIALINKSFVEDVDWRRAGGEPRRIEGYDISNLGATGKVGSMVTFIDDKPDKSWYRKFKIRTVKGQSDVDCLEEVLVRRLTHEEWPLPDIFLIDGGKPQVNRAKKVFRAMQIDRPIVGIAKGPKRKKNEFIFGTDNKKVIKWVSQHEAVLVQVRDEAHRFAISYQKKLRKLA